MPHCDVAGKLEFEVISLEDAVQGVFWGTTSPYIKFTLHDGKLDDNAFFQSGAGEVVQTSVKAHAGGHAKFEEKFTLNKPENMRVLRIRLEDSCLMGDSDLGMIDLDLNHVFLEEHEHNTWVDKKVVVVKDGKDAGTIHLKLKIVV